MVSLIARTPLAGLLPLTIGRCVLTELDVGPVTSIAPWNGATPALSGAMLSAHGLAFPAPNRCTTHGAARALSSGRAQAFLTGVSADPSLATHAALTDQTDGWAVVRLSGPDSVDALARLIPLDLRGAAFGAGHAARSALQHVNILIWRDGEEAFGLMAMRSFGTTLVHDLEAALQGVAARR